MHISICGSYKNTLYGSFQANKNNIRTIKNKGNARQNNPELAAKKLQNVIATTCKFSKSPGSGKTSLNFFFQKRWNRCSKHILPSGEATQPALLLCLFVAAASCCRMTPPSLAVTTPSTRSPTPRPAVKPCVRTPPWTAYTAASSRRMPRPAACLTPVWETPGGPSPPAVSCSRMLTYTDWKFRNNVAEFLRKLPYHLSLQLLLPQVA